jgi:competence protein ComGC
MKSLIGKAKNPIFNSKGEMLMEAIVSVLLLSILLVIIATMIQTSRNMTARSMQEASELQEEQLNLVVLASNGLAPVTGGQITFTASITSGSTVIGIEAGHPIRLYNTDNIVAFFPNPP